MLKAHEQMQALMEKYRNTVTQNARIIQDNITTTVFVSVNGTLMEQVFVFERDDVILLGFDYGDDVLSPAFTDWMTENGIAFPLLICGSSDPHGVNIVFHDEQDVVYFKMRWGV